MTPARLSPPSVAASVSVASRFPFGLAPRGFLLLAAGLLFLVPAWNDPRALVAMLLWNVAVFALAALDVRRMPPPEQLVVSRRWSGSLSLGAPATVHVTVENRARAAAIVMLADHLEGSLSAEPLRDVRTIAPGDVADLAFEVTPTERGERSIGPARLVWRSMLGLAERWGVAATGQDVIVYPSLQDAKRESLFLIRSRQIALEQRRARQASGKHEFESLRDYRPGDERRDVCWTASARRGKLVTKVFQPERSQSVWILVDAGRLQRARAERHTMLDHAASAAFALAQVAMASGDRAGLLAYGRQVQREVPPARGGRHLRQIVDALALVRAEAVEADHAGAAAELLAGQHRRSLVVWLTEVAETAGVPEVIEQASHLATRHVVVFAVMRHPEIPAIASRRPVTAADMYRSMAAQEALERRHALLHGLAQRGALIVESSPSELSAKLVDRYLEVKERGIL